MLIRQLELFIASVICWEEFKSTCVILLVIKAAFHIVQPRCYQSGLEGRAAYLTKLW